MKFSESNIERVAGACHEVNRAYCRHALDDNTQLPWKDAPDWQRESAISGVRGLVADPDRGPGASHESWLKLKTEEGWVWGPVKNPDLKQHPCCVPYRQLPPGQMAKDELFLAVARAVLAEIKRSREAEDAK